MESVCKRHTVAKVSVCPLVEQQCRLEVARRGDFLCIAIGARRVALVAALDPLALNIVAAMRTLPMIHSSPQLLFACAMRSSKVSAGLEISDRD
jgi:hypothetical protein